MSFDKFHDECGIVGVFGHPEAANLVYLGLYALQSRGQEGAGIVSSDGKKLHAHHGLGLVADVFNETAIKRLKGMAAIGHNRYATSGGTTKPKDLQPLVAEWRDGFAAAHNGNLVNAIELRDRLEEGGSIFQSSTDTEVIVHLIARFFAEKMVDRVIGALPQVSGSYSIIFLTPKELIIARDPHGFRPLVIGKLDGAFVAASETCALDLIGADYTREVLPGEVILVNEDGIKSLRPFPIMPTTQCVFEYIYFSRPDSIVFGRGVYEVRKELGRQLARECPTEADLVIPVPDSGIPAALGYAEESGLPFDFGLIRNHFTGRTFIEPADAIRHFGVRVKLNAQRKLLEGKRVVVVDDSIVRGTTSRKIVAMVRNAGAHEVHMRISSPPTVGSCYFGVDTPEPERLIAHNTSVEAVREFIKADSLGYLSGEGLFAFLKPGENRDFCNACFGGDYPVAIDSTQANNRDHTRVVEDR